MKKIKSKIISQTPLSDDIFDLRIAAPVAAAAAKPGQFVNVYCPGADKILPRPLSICGADPDAGQIRFVYRVAGKGTAEIASLKEGDPLEILGPLGNGFPLEEAEGKRLLLIGGGIGIPPLLETARALRGRAEVTAVLGYRELSVPEGTGAFLLEEFCGLIPVCVSADLLKKTGSKAEDPCAGPAERALLSACGGTVLDAVRENGLAPDVIFACGPRPMLGALKAFAAERGIACFLSLEERMACGIGACLACVCETAEKDGHSNVKNRRVCKDGPVFRAEEVVL